MEKPSLEEVKRYFSNAKIIQCVYLSENESEINMNDIREIEGEYWSNSINSKVNNDINLWDKEKGWAKILTYKNTEPKFEITKEQILNLHGNAKIFGCSSVEFRIKEWFPEVFETVLEDNKWCKHEAGALVFKTGKSNGYGFNVKSIFETGINNWSFNSYPENWKEATTEEVTEALKNEAVKLGLKDGAYFLNLNGGIQQIKGHPYLEHNGYLHVSTHEKDWCKQNCSSNPVIFKNGIWASVVETKTIQEAEELLKELGHNFKIV